MVFYNFLFDYVNNIIFWFNEFVFYIYFDFWYKREMYFGVYDVDRSIVLLCLFLEYIGMYINLVYGDLFVFMNDMNNLEMMYGMGFWNLYFCYERD